jgi:resuscitation-promoting factor RpfA
MATLTSVLAQIRQNESGGSYTAQNPTSSASGAYQFIDGTWGSLTARSGIGTQYVTAKSAPPQVQDAVAAYALMENPNANSCSLWGTCDAAGNVTRPARYPIVDTYDITPAQLSSAATLAPGDTTGQGFGSNGTTPVIDVPASGPSDPNATRPTGTGTQSTAGGMGGSPAGNAALIGATAGFLPPILVGGPAALGLSPGTAALVQGDVQSTQQTAKDIASGAESATGSAFRSAWSGLLGGIEDWVARWFLVAAALVLIAVALWRMVSPENRQAFVSGARRAVAA